MDEKDKNLDGGAEVAKMSAHEAPTLMPKGTMGKVDEVAESTMGVTELGMKSEDGVEAADGAVMGNGGVVGEAMTEVEKVSVGGGGNGEVTETGETLVEVGDEKTEVGTEKGLMGAESKEVMTEVETEKMPVSLEIDKKEKVVQPPFATEVAPAVEPAMMADGIEATVGKKSKRAKISRGARKMNVAPIDSTPLMMRESEPLEKKDESKMTPEQLIEALNEMPSNGIAMSRREHKWIKFVRGLIWVGVAIVLPIGAALLVRSGASECLANGTVAVVERWGKVLLYSALGVAAVNLLWGVVRWFKRWNSEKWGIFKALGKMIRGLIIRLLVFTPIVLATLILVVPAVFDDISKDIMMDRVEMAYSGIMTSDTQEFLYGRALPCTDFCSEDLALKRGESKYFYALTKEFAKVKMTMVGNEWTAMKLMGRKGREWTEIGEFRGTMDYTIAEDLEYDALALAVTNDKPEPEEGAPIETDEGLITVQLAVLAGSLVEDVTGAEGDKCFKVKFDNLVDFPTRLFSMMREIKNGEELEKVFGGLHEETGASKLVRHYATVCNRALKNDVDYDKLQLDLMEAIGPNWKVMDVLTGNIHTSVYGTFQPLLGNATGYFLIRAGEETNVVRVRMQEKVPEL